jgi:hypothetical protein
MKTTPITLILIFGLSVVCFVYAQEKTSPPGLISSKLNPAVQRYQIFRSPKDDSLREPTILLDTETGETWQLRVIDYDKATGGGIAWAWTPLKILIRKGE